MSWFQGVTGCWCGWMECPVVDDQVPQQSTFLMAVADGSCDERAKSGYSLEIRMGIRTDGEGGNEADTARSGRLSTPPCQHHMMLEPNERESKGGPAVAARRRVGCFVLGKAFAAIERAECFCLGKDVAASVRACEDCSRGRTKEGSSKRRPYSAVRDARLRVIG
jgi:hypothetical protein